MSDKPKIIVGLVVGLLVLTSPVWYALYTRAGGGSSTRLDLEPPAGALLFGVQWSEVGDDSQGGIEWGKLREQCKTHRVSLSDEARLIEESEGGRWRIVDRESPCLVVKNEETLSVYDARCVEATDYMNANHMDLLRQWRDAVVREGKKTYDCEASGKSYEMSLTKTCMGCDTNRETFCYKCHEYADVQSLHPLEGCAAGGPGQRGIGCWDCHLEAKGD